MQFWLFVGFIVGVAILCIAEGARNANPKKIEDDFTTDDTAW